ncbi:hypothetical protein KIPB_000081 [Kipferlia bialata]|uniref:Uncharacterized protein n=1 Tax=Kipferlia bialata TaxID=797122 RepID=A0A9K3GEN1_9EUKA|nr:hypothetical protein KIPB_000081 [Kipferlia bialata]|eukprot:g81.t1
MRLSLTGGNGVELMSLDVPGDLNPEDTLQTLVEVYRQRMVERASERREERGGEGDVSESEGSGSESDDAEGVPGDIPIPPSVSLSVHLPGCIQPLSPSLPIGLVLQGTSIGGEELCIRFDSPPPPCGTVSFNAPESTVMGRVPYDMDPSSVISSGDVVNVLSKDYIKCFSFAGGRLLQGYAIGAVPIASDVCTQANRAMRRGYNALNGVLQLSTQGGYYELLKWNKGHQSTLSVTRYYIEASSTPHWVEAPLTITEDARDSIAHYHTELPTLGYNETGAALAYVAKGQRILRYDTPSHTLSLEMTVPDTVTHKVSQISGLDTSYLLSCHSKEGTCVSVVNRDTLSVEHLPIEGDRVTLSTAGCVFADCERVNHPSFRHYHTGAPLHIAVDYGTCMSISPWVSTFAVRGGDVWWTRPGVICRTPLSQFRQTPQLASHTDSGEQSSQALIEWDVDVKEDQVPFTPTLKCQTSNSTMYVALAHDLSVAGMAEHCPGMGWRVIVAKDTGVRTLPYVGQSISSVRTHAYACVQGQLVSIDLVHGTAEPKYVSLKTHPALSDDRSCLLLDTPTGVREYPLPACDTITSGRVEYGCRGLAAGTFAGTVCMDGVVTDMSRSNLYRVNSGVSRPIVAAQPETAESEIPRKAIAFDKDQLELVLSQGVAIGLDVSGGSDLCFDVESLFKGRVLSDCTFSHCSITSLAGANLTGCTFTSCTIENLDGASMRRCTLQGCTLSGASCISATLADVSLVECRMQESVWTECRLSGVTALATPMISCDLTGASMSRVDLSGCDLTGGNLRQSKWSGCSLSGAVLPGCDMSTVTLQDVDLSGADVATCTLPPCFRRGWNDNVASFKGVDLSGTSLGDVKGFTGGHIKAATRISGVDFQGVTFSIDFRKDQATPAFRGRDLTGCNFSGCSMQSCSLSGCTLSNAVFTGTDLTGSILTGATVSDATFTDTNLTRCNFWASIGLTYEQFHSAATTQGADITGLELVPKPEPEPEPTPGTAPSGFDWPVPKDGHSQDGTRATQSSPSGGCGGASSTQRGLMRARRRLKR